MTFTVVSTDDQVDLHEAKVNNWMEDGYEIVATGQYFWTFDVGCGVTYWTHMVRK